MAELKLRVQAEYEDAIKCREELEKVEKQMKNLDANATPEQIEKLTKRYVELSTKWENHMSWLGKTSMRVKDVYASIGNTLKGVIKDMDNLTDSGLTSIEQAQKKLALEKQIRDTILSQRAEVEKNAKKNASEGEAKQKELIAKQKELDKKYNGQSEDFYSNEDKNALKGMRDELLKIKEDLDDNNTRLLTYNTLLKESNERARATAASLKEMKAQAAEAAAKAAEEAKRAKEAALKDAQDSTPLIKFQVETAEAEDEVRGLKEEVDELTSKKKKVELELETTEKYISQTTDVDNADQMLIQNAEKYNEQANVTKALSEEISNLEKKEADLKTQEADLMAQSDAMSAKISESSQRFTTLMNSLDGVIEGTEEYATISKQAETALSENVGYENTLSRIKEGLKGVREEQTRVAEQRTKMEEEMSSSQSKERFFLSQNEHLQQWIDNGAEDTEALNLAIQNKEALNKKLEDYNKQIQEKNEQLSQAQERYQQAELKEQEVQAEIFGLGYTTMFKGDTKVFTNEDDLNRYKELVQQVKAMQNEMNEGIDTGSWSVKDIESFTEKLRPLQTELRSLEEKGRTTAEALGKDMAEKASTALENLFKLNDGVKTATQAFEEAKQKLREAKAELEEKKENGTAQEIAEAAQKVNTLTDALDTAREKVREVRTEQRQAAAEVEKMNLLPKETAMPEAPKVFIDESVFRRFQQLRDEITSTRALIDEKLATGNYTIPELDGLETQLKKSEEEFNNLGAMASNAGAILGQSFGTRVASSLTKLYELNEGVRKSTDEYFKLEQQLKAAKEELARNEGGEPEDIKKATERVEELSASLDKAREKMNSFRAQQKDALNDVQNLKSQIDNNGGDGGNMEQTMDIITEKAKGLMGTIAGFAGIGVGLSQVKGFFDQAEHWRSYFQDIESSMKVFLGSAEKGAEFTQKLKDYAYYNMFEFSDLAAASQQMISYGHNVEDIIPRIDQLSNVATGTHGSLMELVATYNRAKAMGVVDARGIQSWAVKGVMIKDVLREMGEQASGSRVTFEQLNKVLDHITAEGGQFHNLMGEMMNNISAEEGQLEDNLASMFEEVGKQYEGVFIKVIKLQAAMADGYKGVLGGELDFGVEAATKVLDYLSENWQKIANTLKEVVAAYGVYKTAMIAHGPIMKMYNAYLLAQEEAQRLNNAQVSKAAIDKTVETGAEIANSTAKKINTGENIKNSGAVGVNSTMTDINTKSKGKNTVATVLLSKAWKGLTTAIMANPYMVAAAAIAALVYAIYAAHDAILTQEKAQKLLNDAADDYKSKLDEQTTKDRENIRVIQDKTASLKDQTLAYKELIKQRAVFAGFTKEEIANMDSAQISKLLNEDNQNKTETNLRNYLEATKELEERFKFKGVAWAYSQDSDIDEVVKKFGLAEEEAERLKNSIDGMTNLKDWSIQLHVETEENLKKYLAEQAEAGLVEGFKNGVASTDTRKYLSDLLETFKEEIGKAQTIDDSAIKENQEKLKKLKSERDALDNNRQRDGELSDLDKERYKEIEKEIEKTEDALYDLRTNGGKTAEDVSKEFAKKLLPRLEAARKKVNDLNHTLAKTPDSKKAEIKVQLAEAEGERDMLEDTMRFIEAGKEEKELVIKVTEQVERTIIGDDNIIDLANDYKKIEDEEQEVVNRVEEAKKAFTELPDKSAEAAKQIAEDFGLTADAIDENFKNATESISADINDLRKKIAEGQKNGKDTSALELTLKGKEEQLKYIDTIKTRLKEMTKDPWQILLQVKPIIPEAAQEWYKMYQEQKKESQNTQQAADEVQSSQDAADNKRSYQERYREAENRILQARRKLNQARTSRAKGDEKSMEEVVNEAKAAEEGFQKLTGMSYDSILANAASRKEQRLKNLEDEFKREQKLRHAQEEARITAIENESEREKAKQKEASRQNWDAIKANELSLMTKFYADRKKAFEQNLGNKGRFFVNTKEAKAITDAIDGYVKAQNVLNGYVRTANEETKKLTGINIFDENTFVSDEKNLQQLLDLFNGFQDKNVVISTDAEGVDTIENLQETPDTVTKDVVINIEQIGELPDFEDKVFTVKGHYDGSETDKIKDIPAEADVVFTTKVNSTEYDDFEKRFSGNVSILIDVNDKEVLKTLDSINGVHIDPKEVLFKANSAEALQAAREIQGVHIDEQTLEIYADNAEAMKKLVATDDFVLQPKTISVSADTKNAKDDIMAIDSLLKDRKMSVAIKTTGDKLPDVKKEDTITFTYKANTDEIKKAQNSIPKGGTVTYTPQVSAGQKQPEQPYSDKTFKVSADTMEALSKLTQVDGIEIADKSFVVMAEDEKAKEDLTAIGAEKIGDKTFRVAMDSKETIETLSAMSNIKLRDKNFSIVCDSKDALIEVQDIKDVNIPDKRFSVLAEYNSDQLKKMKDIPSNTEIAINSTLGETAKLDVPKSANVEIKTEVTREEYDKLVEDYNKEGIKKIYTEVEGDEIPEAKDAVMKVRIVTTGDDVPGLRKRLNAESTILVNTKVGDVKLPNIPATATTLVKYEVDSTELDKKKQDLTDKKITYRVFLDDTFEDAVEMIKSIPEDKLSELGLSQKFIDQLKEGKVTTEEWAQIIKTLKDSLNTINSGHIKFRQQYEKVDIKDRQTVDAQRSKQTTEDLRVERKEFSENFKKLLDYVEKNGSPAEQKEALKLKWETEIEKETNPIDKMRKEAQRDEELANFDIKTLKSEIDWTLLFDGFDGVLHEKIQATIDKLEDYMRSDDFLKLDAEQKKEYVDMRNSLYEKGGAATGSFNFSIYKTIGEQLKDLQKKELAYQQAHLEATQAAQEHFAAIKAVKDAEQELAALRAKEPEGAQAIADAEERLRTAQKTERGKKAVSEKASEKENKTKGDVVKAQGDLQKSSSMAKKGLDNFSNAINQLTNGTLKGFADGLVNIINALKGNGRVDGIAGIGDLFKKTKNKIAEPLKKAETNVSNAANAIQGITGQAESTAQAANAAIQQTSELFDNTQENVKEVDKATETALDAAGAALQESGETWGMIVGAILQLIDTLGDDFAGTIGDIIEKVFDLIIGITKQVTSGDFTRLLIRSLAKAIGDFIAAMIDSLIENIDEVMLTALGPAGFMETFQGLVGWDTEEEKQQEAMQRYEALTEIWDELIDKKREYLNESWGSEAQAAADEAQRMLNAEIEEARINARNRLGEGTGAFSHSYGYRMWEGSYKSEAKDNAGYTGSEGSINWKDVAGDIEKARNVSFKGMEDLLNMDSETLQYIKTNYTGLWATMDGDFKKYVEKLIEYGNTEAEILEQLQERLMGQSLDTVQDDFMNSLYELADGSKGVMDDVADNWQKMINKMVLNNLLGEKYKADLKKWFDNWTKQTKDLSDQKNAGKITQEQYKKQMKAMNEQAEKDYKALVNQAAEEVKGLKDMGIIDEVKSNDQQSATFNSAQNITYEQADALTGVALAQQMILEQIRNWLFEQEFVSDEDDNTAIIEKIDAVIDTLRDKEYVKELSVKLNDLANAIIEGDNDSSRLYNSFVVEMRKLREVVLTGQQNTDIALFSPQELDILRSFNSFNSMPLTTEDTTSTPNVSSTEDDHEVLTFLNVRFDELIAATNQSKDIAADSRDILAGMAIHVEEIRDGVVDTIVPKIKNIDDNLDKVKKIVEAQ